MHIHILGIAGTFMAGIAQLATAMGHTVTGADAAIYPPTSTLLEKLGVKLVQGYDSLGLANEPDLIIIGNAMKRGMPVVEWVLESKIPYTSGPEWLRTGLLFKKTVIAAAGTHGKTTTSSMLAWIFEKAGLNPGFLIGGKPGNFDVSARFTESEYFIIEADEYDTAFFDKRSKFLHYLPKSFILNNLEFDHADIFPDLSAIQTQFHHVVRTIPRNGLVVHPCGVPAIDEIIQKECWTKTVTFGSEQGDFQFTLDSADGSQFNIVHAGEIFIEIKWDLWGVHNVQNALAATIVAHHHGISKEAIKAALESFVPSSRRMEEKFQYNGVLVYDDFAHHPTAIASTLEGFRKKFPKASIHCALELKSHTMRSGYHQATLGQAFNVANSVHLLNPNNPSWDLQKLANDMTPAFSAYDNVGVLAHGIAKAAAPGDIILVMSNGAFGDIHAKLKTALIESAEVV